MTQSLEKTLYHSMLRVAVCVVALVLIFDSGLLSKATVELSDNTQVYLANAVGVKAAVAPTEVNQLTARITELEGELAKERQIDVKVGSGADNGFDKSTFILSSILFILLVLIVINFTLDYLRFRGVRGVYKEGGSQTA